MMLMHMSEGPPTENGPGGVTGAAVEKECGHRFYAASPVRFESTDAGQALDGRTTHSVNGLMSFLLGPDCQHSSGGAA